MTSADDLSEDLARAYETISNLELQLIQKQNQLKQKDAECEAQIAYMKRYFVNREIELNDQIIKLKRQLNPCVSSINCPLEKRIDMSSKFDEAVLVEHYDDDAYKTACAAVVQYIVRQEDLVKEAYRTNSKRFDLIMGFKTGRITLAEMLEYMMPIVKIAYSPKESFVYCFCNIVRLSGHFTYHAEYSIQEFVRQEKSVNQRVGNEARMFVVREDGALRADVVFILDRKDGKAVQDRLGEFEALGAVLQVGFIKPQPIWVQQDIEVNVSGGMIKMRAHRAVAKIESNFALVELQNSDYCAVLSEMDVVAVDYARVQ